MDYPSQPPRLPAIQSSIDPGALSRIIAEFRRRPTNYLEYAVAIMIKARNLAAHFRSALRVRRHFANPWILMFCRLGVIRIPYFLHRVRKGDRNYSMLARPTTTSMADLFVLREVLVDEAYSEVLPLLRENVRIVDVGANLGSFTIWMHSVLKVREAFCFEPEPDSFRLLRFNLAVNGCASAQPLEYAIGGEERIMHLALKTSSPGGTSLYSSESGSGKGHAVKVLAFEQWMSTVQGSFDLLKLDCEGAEWEILRRTNPAVFERFRVVVAEIHTDPENKQSPTEFRKVMEGLGFKTVRSDDRCLGLYVGVREKIVS